MKTAPSFFARDIGLVVLLVSATDCTPGGQFTAAAGATLQELDNTLCTAVGGTISLVTDTPSGGMVAQLCDATLDGFIAAHTEAAPAAVGAVAPRARRAVGALAIKVRRGSPLLPIRGDAKRYGKACAEMHPAIEAWLVKAGR